MTSKLDEKYIQEFLSKNAQAVLSTVDRKGHPEAASIYFASQKNFDILFVTPVNTQNNLNLTENKEVVLNVTDAQQTQTVHIRGKAYATKNLLTQEILEVAEKLSFSPQKSAIPPFLKHADSEKTVVKIKPYEIRMRRYHEKGVEEKIIRMDQ